MSDANLMMQYDANKKSALAAYVLWCFMGLFGAHRFYLGEKGTGAGMLIITLASLGLMFVSIGFSYDLHHNHMGLRRSLSHSGDDTQIQHRLGRASGRRIRRSNPRLTSVLTLRWASSLTA